MLPQNADPHIPLSPKFIDSILPLLDEHYKSAAQEALLIQTGRWSRNFTAARETERVYGLALRSVQSPHDFDRLPRNSMDNNKRERSQD